jgi:restriction system protein
MTGMANKEITVWGIHAGKTGDAETLFFKKNVVALGWEKLGDPSTIKSDRESFKAKMAEAYPEMKPGALPVAAGQVFRFIHELRVGDVVVYPSKNDRQIHIGIIEGDYKYSPSIGMGYPNIRPVKWSKSLPRTLFTQGALYEIGSAMSFFQVKTYADEFLSALEGEIKPIETEIEDESVAYVVSDIEQNTRDFIVKRLSQQLKGHPFSHFIAHLLERMGYQTRVSPEGPDGGIDIIAHKDELGFEPPIIKVQVKSRDGNTSDPEVSALYGKIGSGEFGLFISLGSFTKQAKNFATSKSNLRLIDGDELVNLILHHYEEFDSRYKGLLPLKRVFIPETFEEVDD